MDSLATKRTPKAVQLALRNLPTEISGTHDQAMERIEATNEDDRKIVMNFLLWIAFSRRPLNVAEVEHASAILIGTKYVDQDNILGARELTSMCAGLVIVDASNIVRFVHFSAQSYFRDHRERWFSNGHTVLAQNCLTYLSYRVFETGPYSGQSGKEALEQKMESYPLLDYSASYWGFHAAKAQPFPGLVDQILDFLRSKAKLDSSVQVMWQSDSPDLISWDVKTAVHPLHLAAFFGLEKVVTHLLRRNDFVDCRDSLSTTPLMYAASRGHVKVVQILLREGADPNFSCLRSCTALHRAVAANRVEVVQHLLNAPNINVNCVDTSRQDYVPLMLAATNQNAEIVGLLLQMPKLDINVHTGNQYRATALSLAANYENLDIVRQILAHPNCDVNKRDYWSTPLTSAARAGLTRIVEALLDHGADPEIQEGPQHASGTPLNRAIDYGHAAVVKLLL